MRIMFKVFRSKGFSDLQVEPTARKVAEFVSSLRPEQLVTITHVLDAHIDVMTVWYWQEESEAG